MKKFKILLIILFFCASCLAKTQQEEYQNDILYSEEYFDYLIEQASIQAQEENEIQKQKNEKEISLDEQQETTQDEQDVISGNLEPFKLKIENNVITKYTETFKKEDSKTIIPITAKFSLYQNTTKFKNKYNSNDYRGLVGAEYSFNKYFSVASGLETNYRNLDQVPISKKMYLTPTLNINDKLSISFYNKMNTQSKSTDHDIALKLSPFKSKVADFGVYAGFTRGSSGAFSESISFSTNLYF